MLKVKLDESVPDATLPIWRRDQYLEGDNGGTLALLDFSRRWTWPNAAAPVNGDGIGDVSEHGDASMVIGASGGSVSLAGGGLDFSDCSKGTQVELAASVSSTIWGGGSRDQFYMVVAYLKLPTLADWYAGGAVGALAKFTTSDYLTDADLIMLCMVNGGALQWRRQRAAAAADTTSITPAAGSYGALCQVAFWRTATTQTMRLKSASESTSYSNTTGVNNTQNFSAMRGRFGYTDCQFWSAGLPPATNPNARKFRLYRIIVEDLITSGRDPTTVLNADWARVAASGLFT